MQCVCVYLIYYVYWGSWKEPSPNSNSRANCKRYACCNRFPSKMVRFIENVVYVRCICQPSSERNKPGVHSQSNSFDKVFILWYFSVCSMILRWYNVTKCEPPPQKTYTVKWNHQVGKHIQFKISNKTSSQQLYFIKIFAIE